MINLWVWVIWNLFESFKQRAKSQYTYYSKMILHYKDNKKTWQIMKVVIGKGKHVNNSTTKISHSQQGMIHIWRSWKLSNFEDPTPCSSMSEILPILWPWASNFKRNPLFKWCCACEQTKSKQNQVMAQNQFSLIKRDNFSP